MAASVNDRDLRLGVGLLLFAIGIALVFVRMTGHWGRGWLLLVVVIPFLATLALLRRQASGGDSPAPVVSLLCGLAFAFGVASVGQLANILVSGNGSTGTTTWVGILIALIGGWIAITRRSAVVALLTLIVAAGTVFAATQWIFGYHGTATYRWIALVLAIVYGLSALATAAWSRLAAVLAVASGLLLILIGGSLLVGGVAGRLLSSLSAGSAAGLTHAGAAWGWELILVAGGLTLAAAAALRRDPGVGWAAGIVLALFVSLAATGSGDHSIVGWPLLFAVIAVAAAGFALFSGRGADLLAVAALLLLIATALIELRVGGSWTKGEQFVLVAVPAAFVLACVGAQPGAGISPPWSLSLLAIVGLLYVLDLVERLAALINQDITHAGTATWVLALTTAAGLALIWKCRSAGLALLTLVVASATIVVAVAWLFGTGTHLNTYEYVLVAVGAGFVGLGLAVPAWPRLEAVSGVAGGIAVVLALVLLGLQTAIGVLGQELGSPTPGAASASIAGGWMVVALVATLVLAALAAHRREAGPAYVAGLTVIGFVLLDAARQSGHAASLAIWPLVLLIAGAALAASSGRLAASRPGIAQGES